jgi:hypothetical protein
MGQSKAARAAAGSTANGPRKYAHTGKRRCLQPTIFRPRVQALSAPDDSFVSLGDVAARVLAKLEEARHG